MKTWLISLLGLLLSSVLLPAQDRDDDRRRPAGRVILYEKVGYRGEALVLGPGDSLDRLSDLRFKNGSRVNDSISSIRLEGDVEVVAYTDPGFRGEALRLTESVRDLTGRPLVGTAGGTWNDRISSLHVERSRGRDRDWDRGPQRPGGGRPAADPAKLVKDSFADVLGREPDAGELREFRGRVIDAGWTERMIREHLRTADRYRTELAETIVRRAYREVLGREVDPSGLRQFTRAVRDKGWTEGDVRDALRKSAEYRSKPRG